jgi:transposase-like protein
MTNPEEPLEIHALSPHLRSPEAATEYLERLRWPSGPVCPHCAESGRKPYLLGWTKTGRKKWKCAACRKQFTVTVGTIFEDSKITLDKWLLAFHLLCSSKKGMSALQIQRMLQLKSYKSAWHMCHRIRWAMAEPAFTDLMGGVVEADETYIGGKARNRKRRDQQKRTGRGTDKAPVMVLVERGGKARSAHIANVGGEEVKGVIRKHVATEARLMTDSFRSYTGLASDYASHETVNHLDEWVRGDVHTNTAENFFAILKRGIIGSYHFVSEAHLHRYLSEFDFRYIARHLTDSERTRLALGQVAGRRLMYADSRGGGY